MSPSDDLTRGAEAGPPAQAGSPGTPDPEDAQVNWYATVFEPWLAVVRPALVRFLERSRGAQATPLGFGLPVGFYPGTGLELGVACSPRRGLARPVWHIPLASHHSGWGESSSYWRYMGVGLRARADSAEVERVLRQSAAAALAPGPPGAYFHVSGVVDEGYDATPCCLWYPAADFCARLEAELAHQQSAGSRPAAGGRGAHRRPGRATQGRAPS